MQLADSADIHLSALLVLACESLTTVRWLSFD